MSNKKFNAIIGVAASVLAGFALFAVMAFIGSQNYPFNVAFGIVILLFTIVLIVCSVIFLATEVEEENELDESENDDGQHGEI